MSPPPDVSAPNEFARRSRIHASIDGGTTFESAGSAHSLGVQIAMLRQLVEQPELGLRWPELATSPLLERTERWYSSSVDGDWEHSYGVRLVLDSDAWNLQAELTDSLLDDGQWVVSSPALGAIKSAELDPETLVWEASAACDQLPALLRRFDELVCPEDEPQP